MRRGSDFYGLARYCSPRAARGQPSLQGPLRELKRTACLDDMVEHPVFDLQRVQLGDRLRTLAFASRVDLLMEGVEVVVMAFVAVGVAAWAPQLPCPEPNDVLLFYPC